MGVIKENIIKSEVSKDAEFVTAIVTHTVHYTGKEITAEGKRYVRLLQKVCKDDILVSSYVFHKILISNIQNKHRI